MKSWKRDLAATTTATTTAGLPGGNGVAPGLGKNCHFSVKKVD
jgi:hypothetical protein